MRVEPGRLPGVLILRPRVFEDARGFFMETYNARALAAQGFEERFVQDNHSRSVRATLRGLHFQNPHAQGKLVRVIAGAVFDVAVDVRRGSPTFGQWEGHELSADNKLALYVPPGFAHGFCVLSDAAEFTYKSTDFYAPEHERGVAWDDPDIGVTWPVTDPLLSDKDRAYPPLAACGDALPVYEPD